MIAQQQKRRGSAGPSLLKLKQTFAGAAIAALLIAAPAAIHAAECPAPHQPRIPPSSTPSVTNIDLLKAQLRAYHDTNYVDDIAQVIADARTYVERRAAEVKNAAVVLDIDETSLTNWENIHADDFGFIKGGACPLQPNLPCGFDDWISKGVAPAIEPTRTFFNAIRAKNVSVFFITGRRDNQRDATLLNLDHAGFQGWAKLVTRPDNDTSHSIVPFKSGERAKIQAAGYTIIATIGDQQSDIDGGAAECGFKLPNPFYFIE
jgi:hypothetical protein